LLTPDISGDGSFFLGQMPTNLQRVRFPERSAFHLDLKRRVEEHFEGAARSRHGGWAMGAKSALMIAWLAASWALLMFVPLRAWEAALLSVSVGLAMAGIGFSVMHDANHGGASSSSRVNRAMSFTIDLLGASSHLWRLKHNVLHHTYPNISGLDPDIEAGSPFLRLAPWQPRQWHHRFQHLYVWLLYGLFPLQWWFIHDTRELVTGRIGGHQFPPARGRALLGALVGKALFVTWAFALPALLHPSWALVACWGIAIFVLGNVLAGVFQLAHCVDEADFIGTRGTQGDWAEHQIATTVDFAPANGLLAWYLGGLNFQVEHHLFPQVCHLHYPALSKIVEETCRTHRVRYRCEPTLGSALAANLRWLRRMGSAPAGEVTGVLATRF
jgi:linoleoyl-CoA desaturase